MNTGDAAHLKPVIAKSAMELQLFVPPFVSEDASVSRTSVFGVFFDEELLQRRNNC